MRGTAATSPGSSPEAGLGLVSVVISLLIVALLSLGAVKELTGGTGGAAGAGPGSGSQGLGATVTKAYDVQAQSALSNAMQSMLDDAIANGGLSVIDLGPFGVIAGPSTSASEVSGATGNVGGADGPLGSGSVTLAARSRSGTCWFVWFSTSATWFGDEPSAVSCRARPLTNAPLPGAAAPGTVGWQEGSFPTTS